MIQPAIFFGHGSPMNAIEENQFTRKWREIGAGLSAAKAVVVVSAHYETDGVKVSSAKNQKTIHDFYGFPEELFAVQYPAREHFEMAKKLSVLRDEGVLILGSGNIVHNLQLLNWRGGVYDWAEQFNQEITRAILAKDDERVINFTKLEQAKLAVPTAEHFLPLLYILALRREGDRLEIFNNQIDLGSISMAGVMFL